MITHPTPTPPPEDPNRDLGFGGVVARESRKRFLNRDGSFNVVREGLELLPLAEPLPLPAHHLLAALPGDGRPLLPGDQRRFRRRLLRPAAPDRSRAPAPPACPPNTWRTSSSASRPSPPSATAACIRWGSAANVLVTLESLVGLLGFALATGILFARFSQPTARILFSEQGDHRSLPGHHRLRVPRRQHPAQRDDPGRGPGAPHPLQAGRQRQPRVPPPEARARPRRLLPPRLDDRPPDRRGEPALRRDPRRIWRRGTPNSWSSSQASTRPSRSGCTPARPTSPTRSSGAPASPTSSTRRNRTASCRSTSAISTTSSASPVSKGKENQAKGAPAGTPRIWISGLESWRAPRSRPWGRRPIRESPGSRAAAGNPSPRRRGPPGNGGPGCCKSAPPG